MAVFGGAFDVTVSNYMQVVLSVSLQLLTDILAATWGVSIRFDCSTHQLGSYVGIHMRVFRKGDLESFNLTALPMFDQHTDEIITGLLQRFFNVLITDWEIPMIVLTPDGNEFRTGLVPGVVTILKSELVRGVDFFWRGLRQLDIVMEVICECGFEETFLSLLASSLTT